MHIYFILLRASFPSSSFPQDEFGNLEVHKNKDYKEGPLLAVAILQFASRLQLQVHT